MSIALPGSVVCTALARSHGYLVMAANEARGENAYELAGHLEALDADLEVLRRLAEQHDLMSHVRRSAQAQLFANDPYPV